MRHLLVVSVFALLCSSAAPAQDENLAFKIQEAIDKGVAWLKAKQLADGSFGEASGKTYTPGANLYHAKPRICAFALFCLLKCEVPTTDPVIVKGFAFLRAIEWKGVYEHAIIIMAFRELYHRRVMEYADNKFKSKKNLAERRREAEKYVEGVAKRTKDKVALYGISKSGAEGQADLLSIKKCVERITGWQHANQGWRYGDLGGNDGDQDTSATHLALFGLKAAQACGERIDPSVFAGAAQWLIDTQDKEGEAVARVNPGGSGSWTPMDGDKARGWCYMRDSPNAASDPKKKHEAENCSSMTGAGVIGLMACKSVLLKTRYWNKLGPQVDRAINDGVAWLNKHWTITRNQGPRGTGYLWWCTERVGILGGLTTIGTHNWYLEGAKHIVRIQEPDKAEPKLKGYWQFILGGTVAHEVAPGDIHNTIYALLFLKKHAHSVGIPPITRGGN